MKGIHAPETKLHFYDSIISMPTQKNQKMIRVVLWTDEEFIVPVTYHDRWSVDTLLRAIDLPYTGSDGEYVFFFQGRRLENRAPFPAAVTRQKESVISVVPRKWLRDRRQPPARYESVQCMSAFLGRDLPEIPVPESGRKFNDKLDSDIRESENQTQSAPRPRMDGPEPRRFGFGGVSSSDDDMHGMREYLGMAPLLFGTRFVNEAISPDVSTDEDLDDEDLDIAGWSDMDDEDMSDEDVWDAHPWGVNVRPAVPNLTVDVEALRNQLTPEELEQVRGLCRDHHTSEFTALQVFILCDKQVENAANILRSMNTH